MQNEEVYCTKLVKSGLFDQAECNTLLRSASEWSIISITCRFSCNLVQFWERAIRRKILNSAIDQWKRLISLRYVIKGYNDPSTEMKSSTHMWHVALPHLLDHSLHGVQRVVAVPGQVEAQPPVRGHHWQPDSLQIYLVSSFSFFMRLLIRLAFLHFRCFLSRFAQ